MTYRGHLSRAEIGLRQPRSRSSNIDPEHGGTTGHWAGPAQNVGPHSECIALWRGYQDYHMDGHGWVDIAYTAGVCDHGYSLAGRGAGVRTAANGTNDGNQHWYAVCWIGGKGEQPTADAVDAFWAVRKMLREQGNAGPGVNEHADHKPTSCAGTFGDAIKSGEPTSPPTSPDPDTDEDDEMLKRGDEGDGVKAFQRRMIQWIEGAGRSGDPYDDFLSYGADGDFGPNMEKTVKAFQQAYDLPQTGVIQGVTGSILAMYAVSSGGGGGGGDYAERSHAHNDLYVTKGVYNDHTHDEGATGGPR